MASTLVQSVSMNNSEEPQSVCWSQDDRLAVSADKEIIILKLDVFRGRGIFTGSEASVKVMFSMADLKAKTDLWPDLRQTLRSARRDVQRKVRQRWTYSSLGAEQLASCWTLLLWSPPGVAPNNRTVLAGLTSDHRIIITGMLASGRQWGQLADLAEQLIEQQQEQQGEQQHQEQQQQHQGEEQTDEEMDTESCSIAALSAYSSMLRLAAVDLMWSHVMDLGEGRERCVLLFVVMKNADIVTWNITLPCTGIESCHIVDRQTASSEGIISSLAWTPVPDRPCAGVLAVGYMDGRVEALCYSLDPAATPDTSPHRSTQVIHPDCDFLPVSALAWLTVEQKRLVLLSSKEQMTCAQMVTVDCAGNRWSGEGERSAGWMMKTGPCCQVALGNALAASRIAVTGDTVVMAAGNDIYHLAVTASPTGIEMRVVREVVFHHEGKGWGCVSLDLSPNAVLLLALFRPQFAFNHLNDNFRCPMKMHISPLSTDWDSLDNLMSPHRVSTMSASLSDLLELACHTLHHEPIATETVTMVIDRLRSSPYSDSPVGWTVARHVLSILRCLCKQKELTDQEQMASSAQQQVTERLLCRQVSQVCQALKKARSQVISTDMSVLSTMLNWVMWSDQRSEAVGSECVDQLRSLVGQSQPDICIFCDGDMDMRDGVTVTCANSHMFGLCCHTLALCNTVTYQCCVACGALALSAKTLTGLPWVVEDAGRCTLCQSFLYSTTSSLRF